MFPVYPGFEDLALRVEIEWQERTRSVIARFEQWPNTKNAALVCAFADDDDEGEWLVVDKGSSSPYTLGRPDKLMGKETSYDEATRVLTKTQKFKERGLEKLRDILRRAFAEEDFTVARALELPELPAQRKLAFCTRGSCQWIFGFEHQNWAAFPGQSLFDAPYSQAQAQLRAQWQIAESETRFAWEWAALDDAQRKQRLGWPASWQVMERIMRWILVAMPQQWQDPDDISWTFGADGQTGNLEGECFDLSTDETSLPLWGECLLRHFVPHWRDNLSKRYICVNQYIKDKCYYGANVYLTSRPTAHEQLEAKLALRDWLQDKATPAVAAQLLASLDG